MRTIYQDDPELKNYIENIYPQKYKSEFNDKKQSLNYMKGVDINGKTAGILYANRS